MSGLEPWAEWTLVGRPLGVALLVGGALAVVGTLILLRRVQPPGRPRVRRLLVGVALGMPLALLALWAWAPAVFFLLTCKEGILELVTLPVLFMAAAVFLDGARTGRIRPWGYVGGLACLVVVAEEIDYGQLVFGFATPSWARPHTGRSDLLNFHNTSAATVVLAVGVLAVFAALPLAARLGSTAPLVRRLRLRPPPGSVAGAVLLTTGVINVVGMALAVDANLQEATELSLALMLWAYGLHWWWDAEGAAPLRARDDAPASEAT